MLTNLNHFVIPAPYQVRDKLQRESRGFSETDSYRFLLEFIPLKNGAGMTPIFYI
jgi:hypothetical protein